MNGSFPDFLQKILLYIQNFFHWASSGGTTFGDIYVHAIRWVMPILALFIVLSVIRRMMRVRNPREVWGHLVSDDLGRFSINHWECTVGRARHCDIVVRFATISRTQCALMRDDDGQWYVHDLSGRGTTCINGTSVHEKTPIRHNDRLSIGGIDFRFNPISESEHEILKQNRMERSKPIPPWSSLLALTLFQFLTVLEFGFTRPDHAVSIAFCFALLCAGMWIYTAVTRLLGQTGFEPEILAFFACTLNLAVTATSESGGIVKQTAAILIGMLFFIALGWYLRDIDRVVQTRRIAAGLTVALFAFNLVFGVTKYGSSNWVSVGGMSLQPSEIAKVLFIFAGAATLDRLFVKRNLFGFMMLSGICLLALAIMGDFGTASIFFVVFLVIAFLRSGDFATLSLITGAAAGAALMVIRFKPYVASRFASWGHAWDNVNTSGYQQVRAMSASASGGLIGVGGGNGWLHNVAASNTDLVLGILCEEWGLIIALLAIAIIVTLSIFAFRVVQPGRSSYYTIAACAATSLFVFQTILNVFGSVDLLPLTGVTFPFISCGGSSMISSWGLLAFLKAADTRQDASFAVRRKTSLGQVPYFPDDGEDPILKPPADGAAYSASAHGAEHPAFASWRDSRRKRREEPAPAESAPAEEEVVSEFWNLDALRDEDEIDAFLRQFDEIEEVPNADAIYRETPAVTAEQREIDDFLRQFEQLDREDTDISLDDWRQQP